MGNMWSTGTDESTAETNRLKRSVEDDMPAVTASARTRRQKIQHGAVEGPDPQQVTAANLGADDERYEGDDVSLAGGRRRSSRNNSATSMTSPR